MPVVDSHLHFFTDLVPKTLMTSNLVGLSALGELRRKARVLLKPWTKTLHETQTWVRQLPEGPRKVIDQIGGVMTLPSLLVESNFDDMIEGMDVAGIDVGVVIPHAYASNELVLEACRDNPRLIAAVTVPVGTAKPGAHLKSLAKKGAKVLKIHAAADGEAPHAPRYKASLKAAGELGMPVIIHTGCFHSALFFKEPELGNVSHYEHWFEAHPETQFVLAHMNLHKPEAALDIAEKNPNVWVDTSWQPVEIIAEAVRRIGAERVLFGSDWPIIGHNLEVGITRIQECVEAGWMSQAEADQILGLNAVKLFKIPIN
ncbi:amidohydrolase family protein [bacterium]|nr:amidohydrolase family protein [bacterium]